MKVILVEEKKVFVVRTNEDGDNKYIRDSDGDWWTSCEYINDSFTTRLESGFQEHKHPLKDFVDFCVDNGVDNGIHEMMDKFLKR